VWKGFTDRFQPRRGGAHSTDHYAFQFCNSRIRIRSHLEIANGVTGATTNKAKLKKRND
jgi:hypothetical protein